MTPEPRTDRVLEEIRQSPAWRDAERRVLKQEADDRRKLIGEVEQLDREAAAELSKLRASVTGAEKSVDTARAALADAEAELDQRRSAESTASTSYDGRRRRLTWRLVQPVGDRLAATARAIERAVEEVGKRSWSLVAPRSLSTSYYPVASNNSAEVEAAMIALRALRPRPAELASKIADLSELETALRALEVEAVAIVSRVPTAPPEDWIERAGRAIGAALSGSPAGVRR